MSTTVNYKGSTIAILSNQTKTLDTAGTWLEDDIEVVDAENGGTITQDQDGYIILGKENTGAYRFDKFDTDYYIYYPSTKRLLYSWDLTDSLTDTVSGTTITLSGATQDSNGIHLATASDYAKMPFCYRSFFEYQFDISTMDYQSSSTHGRLIMFNDSNGFILRNGTTWGAYLNGSWSTNSSITDKAYFAGDTLTIRSYGGIPKIYKDNTLCYTATRAHNVISDTKMMIGSSSGQSYFNITVTGIRVYWGGDFDS